MRFGLSFILGFSPCLLPLACVLLQRPLDLFSVFFYRGYYYYYTFFFATFFFVDFGGKVDN